MQLSGAWDISILKAVFLLQTVPRKVHALHYTVQENNHSTSTLEMIVTWNRPYSEVAIDHYDVNYTSANGTLVESVSEEQVTIPAGRNDRIKVRATSAIGLGEWSRWLEITCKYTIKLHNVIIC